MSSRMGSASVLTLGLLLAGGTLHLARGQELYQEETSDSSGCRTFARPFTGPCCGGCLGLPCMAPKTPVQAANKEAQPKHGSILIGLSHEGQIHVEVKVKCVGKEKPTFKAYVPLNGCCPVMGH